MAAVSPRPGPFGENQLAFFHAHAVERVVGDQQIAVQVCIIDQRRKVRGRGHRHGTRDHASEHGLHAERFGDLEHAVGFQHAAALVEFHVDAIEAFLELRNVGGVLAGFVRDDGDVDPGAHPTRLFQHFGGHRLLDELHAHLFQPVDLADRLFLVLPPFVRVHAQRLLGHGADGFDGRLIGGQPDLHFEHRVVRRFPRFLLRDLRGIDADRKRGEGRVPGVESEIRIERNAQALTHPVHQRDIDRGLARPLARHALEDLGHDLGELHRVGGEQQIAHALHGLLRAHGILVVTHDGRAFAVSRDAAASERGVQGIAVLAGGHGGRPGVLQVEPLDLGSENGSTIGGGRRGQSYASRDGHYGCGLQKLAAVHFNLLAATSSLVQWASLRSSMRTIGVRCVVALMNFPSPM